MPMAPRRPCRHRGCAALVERGYCETHAPVARAQRTADDASRRGTASSRGYTSIWRRLRSWVLSREPLCRHCSARGLIVAAVLVEREGMMAEARDAERRFRRLAETSPLALFRTDEDGVVTYGNAKWCELFGATAGAGWLSLVSPQQQRSAAEAWRQARAARHSFIGDYELTRADGGANWVGLALNPEIDHGGRIIAWTGAATDIDERRRAELAMAESERQYRLLADHSNDMIVRIGLDGIRRFVSPACRSIGMATIAATSGTCRRRGISPSISRSAKWSSWSMRCAKAPPSTTNCSSRSPSPPSGTRRSARSPEARARS